MSREQTGYRYEYILNYEGTLLSFGYFLKYMDTDTDTFVISEKVFGYGYRYVESIHGYLNGYIFRNILMFSGDDGAFIQIANVIFS